MEELIISEMETPAGTIKIAENLYVDRTEITNFNWAEYLYWIKRSYPGNSKLYNGNLPDTNSWLLDGGYCLKDFYQYYLSHPAYKNYPVVGISQQQAIDFSKWRSDRVMEYILVREGLIKWNNTKNPDSLFTIEKYFTGNYNGYIPSDKIKFYPKYFLPDSTNWKQTFAFADSVYLKNDVKIKKLKCISCTKGCTVKIDSCMISFPTMPTLSPKCDFVKINHLRGNVRELSAYEGISFGEGWKDSLFEKGGIPKYYSKSTNSFTGFRNICVWKEWDK